MGNDRGVYVDAGGTGGRPHTHRAHRPTRGSLVMDHMYGHPEDTALQSGLGSAKEATHALSSHHTYKSSRAWRVFVALTGLCAVAIFSCLASENDDFLDEHPVRYNVAGRPTRYEGDNWAAGWVSISVVAVFYAHTCYAAFHRRTSESSGYLRDGFNPGVHDFILSCVSSGFVHAGLFLGVGYYTGQNDIYQLVVIGALYVSRGAARAAMHSKYHGPATLPSRVMAVLFELVCLAPVVITIINYCELEAFKTLPTSVGAAPADASAAEAAAIWVWVSLELLSVAYITMVLAMPESAAFPPLVPGNNDKTGNAIEDNEVIENRTIGDRIKNFRQMFAGLALFAWACVYTAPSLLFAGPDDVKDSVYTATSWHIGSVLVDHWTWAMTRYFVTGVAGLLAIHYTLCLWKMYRAEKRHAVGDAHAEYDVQFLYLFDPQHTAVDCLVTLAIFFTLCQHAGIDDIMEASTIAVSAGVARTVIHLMGYRKKTVYVAGVETGNGNKAVYEVGAVVLALLPHLLICIKALDVAGDLEHGTWALLGCLAVVDTLCMIFKFMLGRLSRDEFSKHLGLITWTSNISLMGRATIWGVGIWYGAGEHPDDAIALTG